MSIMELPEEFDPRLEAYKNPVAKTYSSGLGAKIQNSANRVSEGVTIQVSNVPKNMSEVELENLFSQCGNPKICKVRRTSHKLYMDVLVRYSKMSEVQSAIKRFNGQEPYNLKLSVVENKSQNRQELPVFNEPMAPATHDQIARSTEKSMSTPTPSFMKAKNNFQVPDAYQDAVFNFLLGFRNGTVDFQRGHLRLSTSRFCNPLVFCYCALITAGLVSNLGLLYCLLKQPSPRPIFTWHFANLAGCDIFKCTVVLPVTLINILYHNWRLGEMACYVFPMMQEIPLHVSGWTFYFVPVQHLQFLRDPGKALQTLKPKILIIWLISFLMVLPYAYYTLYIDLGSVLNHQFQGTGICGITGKGNVYDYLRGIFIILFLLPLVQSYRNFKKVEQQLQIQELSRVVTSYIVKTSSPTKRLRWLKCCERLENPTEIGLQRTFLDIRKEKLSHKYFVCMLMSHAVSLVPLLCFRVYLIFIDQTSLENNWIIFGVTTWIAFLSTCTTSLLYASWQLSL